MSLTQLEALAVERTNQAWLTFTQPSSKKNVQELLSNCNIYALQDAYYEISMVIKECEPQISGLPKNPLLPRVDAAQEEFAELKIYLDILAKKINELNHRYRP